MLPPSPKLLVTSVARQREIVEVLIRYGWDYMRQVLTLGKSEEPEIPAPEILSTILTDLGPVYVKLGQLLSTRPDILPPNYVEALSHLRSQVPPVAWTEIEIALRQQLGCEVETVFASISPSAVAAGSIAQIHRATLKTGEQVAVKIQRPGIAPIVARDIAVFTQIAGLLSGTDFGKRYNIVALAEEFGASLQSELDFTVEANYTDRLRANLSQGVWFDASRLQVPKVYHAYSNQKLLVLEWLEGQPLLQANLEGKQFAGDAIAERHGITTLLFRAFLQQYLVDGFFHADPHPGNLFYLADGRVAILDCGMMGRLEWHTQALMVELLLAIIDFDPERCTQITLKLAKPMDLHQPINLLRLQTDYDRLLRRYVDVSLNKLNVGHAFSEVLEAARLNNLRLPSNIGLLAKSLANLEGAGREFDPTINIVSEIRPLMMDLFQRQLLGEDPARSLLRTALEVKELALESPRQVSFLLSRLSSESLRFNLAIQDLNGLRRTLDDAANRRSFSTVVGALIIGAAIISTGQQTPQLQLLSIILFGVASFLGLWLVVKILRSGRLK